MRTFAFDFSPNANFKTFISKISNAIYLCFVNPTGCEYDQRQNGALPSVRDVITHALHFQNLLSGSEKVSKFKKPAQILVANFYFLDLKKASDITSRTDEGAPFCL